MDGATTVSDSHDWERDCKRLFSLRYQGELQLIDTTREAISGSRHSRIPPDMHSSRMLRSNRSRRRLVTRSTATSSPRI